jgi:hypothetical protein
LRSRRYGVVPGRRRRLRHGAFDAGDPLGCGLADVTGSGVGVGSGGKSDAGMNQPGCDEPSSPDTSVRLIGLSGVQLGASPFNEIIRKSMI